METIDLYHRPINGKGVLWKGRKRNPSLEFRTRGTVLKAERRNGKQMLDFYHFPIGNKRFTCTLVNKFVEAEF